MAEQDERRSLRVALIQTLETLQNLYRLLLWVLGSQVTLCHQATLPARVQSAHRPSAMA